LLSSSRKERSKIEIEKLSGTGNRFGFFIMGIYASLHLIKLLTKPLNLSSIGVVSKREWQEQVGEQSGYGLTCNKPIQEMGFSQ
jgi:hypothetical protein